MQTMICQIAGVSSNTVTANRLGPYARRTAQICAPFQPHHQARDKQHCAAGTTAQQMTAEQPQTKMVLVVAAALIDKQQRVLLAQRPEGKAMAGLWEFPGGKVMRCLAV